LTPEEFGAMKRHTLIGANHLAGGLSSVEGMSEEIARCHHEKWDGSGYPHGLSGDAIPLPARIVAVADFYDALSYARTYRPAWETDRIYDEIRDQTGKHFDPEIVAAFFELVETGLAGVIDEE